MKDTDRQVLGGSGVIDVAGLAVTILPLSLRDELALMRRLQTAAEQYHGDPYTRVKDMLAGMSAEDRVLAVRETVRLAVCREPLSAEAVGQYRMTHPDWVAEEVYARGRKGTAGLTLEGVRAVLNEANAPEVFQNLWEAMAAVLEAGGPK